MYDLHTHSHCSDGILSPQALVSRAKSNGVSVLALTDHDTVMGVEPARTEAQAQGIQLINGIEFSTLWNGIGVHVVGLNVDIQHPSMQEAVAVQEQSRQTRAAMIAERLAKAGIGDALAGAEAIADGAVVGRPHFAKFLVAEGVVPTINAAFKKYLGAGKIGDVKQLWPEVGQAVTWVREAGGVAVLAHPVKYKMTRSKLCRLVEDFQAAGGQAIEVISGKQQPNITKDLTRIATKYELYASCGSDFHVPDQHWQELGAMEPLPSECRPVWLLWEQL